MKNICLFLILSIALSASGQTTAAPAAPAVTSITPAPSLNFTVAASDLAALSAAQAEYKAAQQALKKAQSDWNAACVALKAAKGWPARTNCRIQDGAILPAPIASTAP